MLKIYFLRSQNSDPNFSIILGDWLEFEKRDNIAKNIILTWKLR
jgi:hypothetical protein